MIIVRIILFKKKINKEKHKNQKKKIIIIIIIIIEEEEEASPQTPDAGRRTPLSPPGEAFSSEGEAFCQRAWGAGGQGRGGRGFADSGVLPLEGVQEAVQLVGQYEGLGDEVIGPFAEYLAHPWRGGRCLARGEVAPVSFPEQSFLVEKGSDFLGIFVRRGLSVKTSRNLCQGFGEPVRPSRCDVPEA